MLAVVSGLQGDPVRRLMHCDIPILCDSDDQICEKVQRRMKHGETPGGTPPVRYFSIHAQQLTMTRFRSLELYSNIILTVILWRQAFRLNMTPFIFHQLFSYILSLTSVGLSKPAPK